MNWGQSIVLAFVLFAAFIGSLVVVCLRQDVQLIAPDYYQQELLYQRQLDRMNNANQLAVQPVLRVSQGWLGVEYAGMADMQEGTLQLFRPSDERFDRNFKLSSETEQHLDVRSLPPGVYKARLKWTMQGKEYFLEEVIYL
jgi:hypothetical protein